MVTAKADLASVELKKWLALLGASCWKFIFYAGPWNPQFHLFAFAQDRNLLASVNSAAPLATFHADCPNGSLPSHWHAIISQGNCLQQSMQQQQQHQHQREQ